MNVKILLWTIFNRMSYAPNSGELLSYMRTMENDSSPEQRDIDNANNSYK